MLIFLIEINNIITGSNITTLSKVSVKHCGFHKMYMEKDIIEDNLNQIIDQFIEKKIIPAKFYSILFYLI